MGPSHVQVSGSSISLYDHVHVMALADAPVRLSVFEDLGEISIGRYCIVNPGVRITSASSIEIGDSCMIAMNAYLSDADWHDIHHRIYAPGSTAPIILQDNVWVGDSALVCKGVTIGENSIVGAYSVVTKDVPANSIVAGNPARKVGEVNPEHLTTRADLFNGPVQYEEFEAEYFRKKLRGNTLFKWLTSQLIPGSHD